MTNISNIKPVAAKVARMLLVFALVFYTSLRVEVLVAFGDDSMTDDGKHAEDATVSSVMIYQRTAGQNTWHLVPGSDKGEAQQRDVAVTIAGEAPGPDDPGQVDSA